MRRDGRRRTTRRAAWNKIGAVLRSPRVLCRPIKAACVRRAHGEFIEVGFAEHHRPTRLQLGGNRQFVRRHEAVENVRGGGRQDAPGAEQVLDRDRNAVERPGTFPARRRASASAARTRASLRRFGDKSIEVAVGGHGIEARVGQLDCGECLPTPAARAPRRDRAGRGSPSFHDLRHHEAIVDAARGIGEDGRRIAAIGHLVRAKRQEKGGDTGHRGDTLGINFAKLLDPARGFR